MILPVAIRNARIVIGKTVFLFVVIISQSITDQYTIVDTQEVVIFSALLAGCVEGEAAFVIAPLSLINGPRSYL